MTDDDGNLSHTSEADIFPPVSRASVQHVGAVGSGFRHPGDCVPATYSRSPTAFSQSDYHLQEEVNAP